MVTSSDVTLGITLSTNVYKAVGPSTTGDEGIILLEETAAEAKVLEAEMKLLEDKIKRGEKVGGLRNSSADIPRSPFKSIDEFAKSFDPTKKLGSPIRGEAWNYFKQAKWKKLEELFKFNKINGGWPPNRGFIRFSEISLNKGAKFDRYGGRVINGKFSDRGTFASPAGASFESRALPAETLSSPYKTYEVVKAIPGVKSGEAIPWFGQPGMGIQYQFPKNIDQLLKERYIVEIP